MKSSSIANHVFNVNLRYTRLQNQTKELFFNCLDEGRDIEYFREELEKIWGVNDTDFIENQIIEYREYIHYKNTGEELTKNEKKQIKPVGVKSAVGAILLTNELFKKAKSKEYKIRRESYGYKTNKQEYLVKLVPKYTNDIKPYYRAGQAKTRDNLVRLVSPNTYNSMVYNTTLTQNSWRQTLNDALSIGKESFIIRYHPFSCEHCIDHQYRVMSRLECLDILGTAEEGATELLHPNCKCELEIFDGKYINLYDKQYNFTNEEKIEISDIRQKVNSLTLEKERLLSDKKIYKRLGAEEDIDKVNSKIKKVNQSIKQLQEALPTTELKKQVVAINR